MVSGISLKTWNLRLQKKAGIDDIAVQTATVRSLLVSGTNQQDAWVRRQRLQRPGVKTLIVSCGRIVNPGANSGGKVVEFLNRVGRD
jgi:hypothetical protein